MELALIKTESIPDHWLQVHQLAAGASLTAGAIAYAVTNVAGKAATTALANTVRVGGSVASYTGWWIAGGAVGFGLQAGTHVAVAAIETAGESATMVGSLLVSTAAALTVGTTVMIGNTLYTIYKNSRISQPLCENPAVVESEDDEFVVYLLEDKPADVADVADADAVDITAVD